MAQSGPRKLKTHCSRIDDSNVRGDASEENLRAEIACIKKLVTAKVAENGREARKEKQAHLRTLQRVEPARVPE
jgi:hypothetical protein